MTQKHWPNTLRQIDSDTKAKLQVQFKVMQEEREARTARLPAIRKEGAEALRRLLPIAQSDTGQSAVIARFLLNLYNGDRFPFDMTDFRRLDGRVVDDCFSVLKVDAQSEKEVHDYFANGAKIWEKLAVDWRFKDHYGVNWRKTESPKENQCEGGRSMF